jgi:multidrug resistance efflux pump
MARQEIETTYNAAQKVCGQVVLLGISYPDASTSLDSMRAAQDRLIELQKGMDKGNYDAAEFAKILRMAQHDLAMSDTILKNNELIMKHGINLKLLRQHNLNLQKSRLALQQSKEELMKTEILAPFDGTVVKIDVKENDQLSAYDYAAITAVHLVDTKTVELEGVVDELDIFKVKTGQKATITIDALPGRKLTGTVIFISPYGADKTGVVNFKVIIKLDPTDLELKGGLTATANIIIDEK